MNRRGYLAGVSAFGPLIAGCADSGDGDNDERSSADAVDPDDTGFTAQRWGHVDVVEWGADPTGSEDVTPILEEIVDEEGENGLLVFPPGTYLMEEGFSHANFENFGLVGQDATIEVSSEFDGVGIHDNKVFAVGPSGSVAGQDVYVGGFEFDFTNLEDEDDPPATGVVSYATGRIVFENLWFPDGPANGGRMIELMGRRGSRGRIHDCYVAGAPGAGIYANPDASATVRITDCTVENCDDNGFYCSDGQGRVIIENCTATNNDISNVRLGGVVRDSSVFVTDSDLENARGYWLRDGDCRIENCYGYHDADDSRALLNILSTAESVTLTNSKFEVDSNVMIAVIHERERESPQTVIVRDCAFVGEKDASTTDSAISVHRDDTTFRYCTSELTGNVHPIQFEEAANCQVVGGRYVAVDSIRFASGSGGLVRDVSLETDADSDLEIEVPDVVVENVDGDVSEGVRTVVDGVGDNGADDPAAGGDWNGNGRDGLLVTWTDESDEQRRLSLYRAGEWHSWPVE